MCVHAYTPSFANNHIGRNQTTGTHKAFYSELDFGYHQQPYAWQTKSYTQLPWAISFPTTSYMVWKRETTIRCHIACFSWNQSGKLRTPATVQEGGCCRALFVSPSTGLHELNGLLNLFGGQGKAQKLRHLHDLMPQLHLKARTEEVSKTADMDRAAVVPTFSDYLMFKHGYRCPKGYTTLTILFLKIWIPTEPIGFHLLEVNDSSAIQSIDIEQLRFLNDMCSSDVIPIYPKVRVSTRFSVCVCS